MAIANLRIATHDNGLVSDIYLNDESVGRYIKSLDLHIGAVGVTEVVIKIHAFVDIPEGLLAAVSSGSKSNVMLNTSGSLS